METDLEVIDGRKYKVLRSNENAQPGAYVVVGPPEGLVDTIWTSRGMDVPEPFATNFHNILYDRGLFTYREITSGNNALGVLQEALQVDAQILAEAFKNFEMEPV